MMYTYCISFVTFLVANEQFHLINILFIYSHWWFLPMRKLFLSLFSLLFSSIAMASDKPVPVGATLGWGHAPNDPLSIGLALAWEDSPYKGYKNHFTPVPTINYDSGIWYLEDLTLGVYLYNQNQQNITLSLNFLDNKFSSNNSRDNQLYQLSKRYPTLLAVLEYAIDTQIGSFSANIGHDTLDVSQSTLINLEYSVPILGENWVILSTLGLNWADGKHNNNYYGVSHDEAIRSGLSYHNAHSSLKPYISITGQYSITKQIRFFSGIEVERLTGDAANSPMVARKTIPTFYAGLIYGF